uniref:CpsD/CapB family tyrosine-protein kinase n=1 Tax=Echinococcus granulosus TaxID=6210 RepID=A0A068WR34_ECHGR|nr:hypothetical protein EgrG_002026600 [Echinococcus granulosus]
MPCLQQLQLADPSADAIATIVYALAAMSSQTIVVLDPAMLGGPTSRGVTPPPYASVVPPMEQTSEN